MNQQSTMPITIKASAKSTCALGKLPDAHGSCLSDDHVNLISNYSGAAVDGLPSLRDALGCKDDICVLTKAKLPEVVKNQITREALKATADSLDGSYWMNNTEIDTCLSQMRIQFPGFAHTFIHMSDMVAIPPSNLNTYQYKVRGLSEINLGQCIAAALKGKSCEQLSTYKDVPLTSIGTIFNTDTSQGSGQHWFAVYISFDNVDVLEPSKKMVMIEVFNSSGLDIKSSTFQKFWEEQRLAIQKATGLRCEKKLISTIQHQRDDTGNCGSYSLFYIYSRLAGNPSEKFDESKVTDAKMQAFRKICFVKGGEGAFEF